MLLFFQRQLGNSKFIQFFFSLGARRQNMQKPALKSFAIKALVRLECRRRITIENVCEAFA
jgi:hypothetical protein